MYAAMNDNVDAVQWLIETAGADPNKLCKVRLYQSYSIEVT